MAVSTKVLPTRLSKVLLAGSYELSTVGFKIHMKIPGEDECNLVDKAFKSGDKRKRKTQAIDCAGSSLVGNGGSSKHRKVSLVHYFPFSSHNPKLL